MSREGSWVFTLMKGTVCMAYSLGTSFLVSTLYICSKILPLLSMVLGLGRLAVTTEKWTTIHSRLLLNTRKMTLSG